MRNPFDVVLRGAGVPETHISRKVDGLAFSAASPGGFSSVTLSLQEPILSDFLTGYSELVVYDAATSEVAAAGRLTDPGRSTGSSGEVWSITAIGEGPLHMADVTAPYVLFESSQDGWSQSNKQSNAGTAEVGATPDGTSDTALVLGAPGGSVVPNGAWAAMYFERFADCGVELGGYAGTRLGGKVDANWRNETFVIGRDGTPVNTSVSSATFTAGGVAIGPFVVVTDFPTGADVLRYQITRNGGVTIADDTTWGALYNVWVAARRKLKDGTNEANASHSQAYVLASEVVADLLGRGLLPRFDGANATITTSSHHFDQMSYIDGVTPGGIINDLLAAEAFTWHAWEKNPTTGLFRFEFVAWPTTTRYNASVVDGFDSPAPTSDVYNKVNVRYRDKRGRVAWATRTQTVASLDALGLTRTAMVDLADEVGSLANANKIGDQFLADHASPPNAGTLRVSRPVMDSITGRMTKPWMIRPGNLIRVRGVRPYVDSLNATARDGVTVFRIISVTYSDSDGTATLELDTYSPTEARQIERLTNVRRRKR